MSSPFPLIALLATLLLAGCAAPRRAAAPKVRATGFNGLHDFSHFIRTPGTNAGEIVLTSPPFKAPLDWDELVVSWNAAPGDHLTVEARVLRLDHFTKYYTLGRWSDDPTQHPRESVPRQTDPDGTVKTDTLILKRPGGDVQLRLTLGGKDTNTPANLKYLALSFCDGRQRPDPAATNSAAWGKILPVPELRQGDYPEQQGWCSPTSLSMVLAYWGNVLKRPELNRPVPEVAHAIHDAAFDGTGNWPFNTAYAGAFPGLRAYVTRLNDLSELEDWINSGVPVIISVSSYLTNDRRSGRDNGHLIVCAGFTATGDFVANDPGVSVKRNESARRVYPRARVIEAWKKSKNAVYLIYPESLKPPRNRSGTWDSK